MKSSKRELILLPPAGAAGEALPVCSSPDQHAKNTIRQRKTPPIASFVSNGAAYEGVITDEDNYQSGETGTQSLPVRNER